MSRGGGSDLLTVLVGTIAAAALLGGLATWVENGGAEQAIRAGWGRVFGEDEGSGGPPSPHRGATR